MKLRNEPLPGSTMKKWQVGLMIFWFNNAATSMVRAAAAASAPEEKWLAEKGEALRKDVQRFVRFLKLLEQVAED